MDPLATRLTEEAKREAREAERQDREFVDVMHALVGNASFAVYVSRLRRIVQERGSGLLEPIREHGMENVLLQEYTKGYISGLLFAADLPANIIAQYDAQRTSQRGESEP